MMNRYYVGICISFLLLFSLHTFAAPNALNIQGKLTNTGGTLQTGTFNFTFRIYDNYTNGTMLYETNITSVTDSRGIYDVVLADINLPFDKQYFLGVKVNTDTEMTPRINLTSVPYSFTANGSEGLNTTGTAVANQLDVGGGFTSGGITIQSDGSIVTHGDIIFSGNITILNVSNLNVNGSLIPDVDNTFDIGNGSNRWRNANFSGTLYANELAINNLELGWTNLTNYPSTCAAGEFVTAVGDTITCASPGSTSTAAAGWTNTSNDTITSRNVIVTTKDNTDFFIINTSLERIGIGTVEPNKELVVVGSINVTDSLNVSGSIEALYFIGDGSLLAGLTVYNNENLTAFIGDNDSILRTSNLTIIDGSIQDDFDISNLTNFLGGSDTNVSLIRSSNITWWQGTYDAVTSRWELSNFTAATIDHYGENASIIRVGNITNWDTDNTDDLDLSALDNDSVIRTINITSGDINNITLVSQLANDAGYVTSAGSFDNNSDSNVTNFVANNTLFVNGSRVGIGNSSPTSKLYVQGEVQVASENTSCSSTTAGAIRYDSDGLAYCDGTRWSIITTGATSGLTPQMFGAACDTNTNDTAALKAWISAIISTNLPGHLGKGICRSTQQLVINLSSAGTGVAGRGFTMRGAGYLLSTIHFDPNITTPAFFVVTNTSNPTFNWEMTDFAVTGNSNGTLVQVGQTDLADFHNGFLFRMWVTNANNESGAIAFELGGIFNADITIVANGFANNSGIAAAKFNQVQFSRIFGGFGHSNVGLYLTNGFNFGNTFQSLDVEEVQYGVKIDNAQTTTNTFLGGVFTWQTAAIQASAGNNNRFINPTWSNAVPPTTDGVVGIIIDEYRKSLTLQNGSSSTVLDTTSGGSFHITNYGNAFTSFTQSGQGFFNWYTNGSEQMRLSGEGNLGLNSTNPREKLVVHGNVNISGTLNASGRISFPNLASCDTIDTDANGVLSCGTDDTVAGGNNSLWNETDGEVFPRATDKNVSVNTSVLFVDTENDRVGVGTSSPGGGLHVSNTNFIITGGISSVQGGSAGSPSYQFFGESDTGMFLSGTNELGFSTTGEERMTIGSGGNVGIGTANPSGKLQIDTSTVGDGIYINSSNGNSVTFRILNSTANLANFAYVGANNDFIQGTNTGDILLSNERSHNIKFGVGSTIRATISSSGEFGIGNLDPNITLDVSGDGNISGILYADQVNVTNNIRAGDLLNCDTIDTDAEGNFLCGTDSGSGFQNNSDINVSRFVANNTLFVNDSRVGVGIGSPNVHFHVEGAPVDAYTPLARLDSTANIAAQLHLYKESAFSGGLYGDGVNIVYLASTGTHQFFTGADGSSTFGTAQVIIENDGDVGIGTISPAEKLVVIGNANISGTLNVSGRVSFPDLSSCDTIDTDANGVLSCGSDAGGNGQSNSTAWNRTGPNVILANVSDSVGIGTNSPQANLHIFPRLGQVVALNITSEIAGMTTTAIISDAANGAEPLLRLVGDSNADAGGPNNFVFTKDGDLGVGIINPTARLHVNTSAADSVEIAHFTTNGSTQIQIDTDSNNNIIQRFLDSTGTEKIKFHTGGTSFIDSGDVGIGTVEPTEKLVIMGNVSINASTGVNTTLFVDSTNGRVGINNSNPTALLTVGSGTDSAGQSNVAGLFTNDGATTFAIRDSLNDVEGNMFVTSGGVYIGSFTDSVLTFRTGNLDQMMLTTDGYLGIGTRNPRARLEVLGNTTFLGNMTLGNTTAPVNLTMYSPNGNAWRCGPDNSGTWSCSN